jgi:hypothetical protein
VCSVVLRALNVQRREKQQIERTTSTQACQVVTPALLGTMGFNASAEFKPKSLKTVDFEVDYSRSVPLRLNTFSFGIALDIAGVLRSHAH